MKGIELVVKNILTNRKPSSNGFFTESYPIFKEEIAQILSNMYRILKRKKCFPDQFLRQTSPLFKTAATTTNRCYKNRILSSCFCHEYRHKTSKQNLSKLSNIYIYIKTSAS